MLNCIDQIELIGVSMQKFWGKIGWEIEDRHLSAIEKMPFKRNFPFIPKEKGLYIIRGPRQIGKSSWLKAVLSHYAKVDSCFYLSCENISDNKELAEILISLRGTKIILLDEINFVRNWDRAIKHEVDIGQHHIIMLTGSHAHDIKKGSDLMPGRFDAGGDFNLLPMLFNEFVEMRKQAGWASEDRLEELEVFFRVGGFPSAILEAGKEGKIPQNSLKTFWKWLKGDFIKLGKDADYLEELIIQLCKSMQNPVSYQTLAKKTAIGSHNTVKEYLSVLESCFALRQLKYINLDTGAFHPKKDKKHYFTDPLLFHLSLQLAESPFLKEAHYPKIAELVANESLNRSYRRFGYFKNKSGEIDFISPKNWAREVKWSDIPSDLSRSYLNLGLADKKVWTKANFLADLPGLKN